MPKEEKNTTKPELPELWFDDFSDTLIHIKVEEITWDEYCEASGTVPPAEDFKDTEKLDFPKS